MSKHDELVKRLLDPNQGSHKDRYVAASTITRLNAELASALEALQPFAKEAELWGKDIVDDAFVDIKGPADDVCDAALFTVGDLRRAAAELAKHKKEG